MTTNGTATAPTPAGPHGPHGPATHHFSAEPLPPQSIPYPKTSEDARLLVLRYRILSEVRSPSPKIQSEMDGIYKVLVQMNAKQKQFRKRLEVLRSSASRSKKAIQPQLPQLKAQLQAYKLLAHDVDLPSELRDALEEHAGSPSVPHDETQSFLTSDAEQILKNTIAARMAELESLPANLGTFTVAEDPVAQPADAPLPNSDRLRLKALIELKQLRLLGHQKALRQQLLLAAANTTPFDNEYAINSRRLLNRSLNCRAKSRSTQVAKLLEQLEQQRLRDKERKRREAKRTFLQHLVAASEEVVGAGRRTREKRAHLFRNVLSYHVQTEKEEAKKLERTAKQRLAALKSNDEEAYLKLLDQTKDTRLTHLLKQTNSFLDSLAAKVKVQQAETRELQGEDPGDLSDTEEGPNRKVDYYKVAHRIQEEVTQQPSILVGGQLKEYQLKGLQWMVSLYNNHLNGILADEMGLGKTIQSLSLITYLIEKKRNPGPFLVIVPLSTITNWTLEFEKWAPSVKKIVYKGAPPTRKALQQQIRSGDFNVLLTTYEYIIKDRPILARIKWEHMIMDEGHRLKNTQSKLSATLTQYYTTKYRLILTGTPLQNNLPELWALLNFVLPKIFNSVKTFDEWFNTPFANTGGQGKMELTEEETLLIIRRLHRVLRPFLLRRLKRDVEKDLPDKVEKVIKCKMSALQSRLYSQMLLHNALFVGSQTDEHGVVTSSGIKGVNNKIMQLRKICNHPYCYDEVESALLNDSKHPYNVDNIWRTAGKFELLDRVLPKLQKSGHRVLMFFQMTQVMDIMEDYLTYKGLQYLRLDGQTKAEDRTDMLKVFNAPDSPYFCFLLSTRAGGLGLNLQTADTVIIYDSDWNPHQDLQAQDRAHRIGQKNEVRILRLIVEDSVEEVILERAMQKLDIDGKVIQAGKFDNKSTAEEQEAFLRKLIEAEESKRDGHQGDQTDYDDYELNEILARSDYEQDLFKKIDEEREAEHRYAKPGSTAAGKNPDGLPERLVVFDELPDVFKEDIREHLEPTSNEPLGRGARERKQVLYDDGLTEEQWLDAIEAAEKAEAESRAAGKNTDQIDEIEGAVNRKRSQLEASRKRRRSRKAGGADEVSDGVEESEDSRSSKRLKSEEVQDEKPAFKDTLQEELYGVLEKFAELTDEDGRQRNAIFIKLPSRRMYRDYYQIIKKPVSLTQIRQRILDGRYADREQFAEDVRLMVSNAKTYNEPDSFVYNDAEEIEKCLNQWLSASEPSDPSV